MQIAIVSFTALEGITNIVSSQETPGGGDSPRRKRDLSLMKKGFEPIEKGERHWMC